VVKKTSGRLFGFGLYCEENSSQIDTEFRMRKQSENLWMGASGRSWITVQCYPIGSRTRDELKHLMISLVISLQLQQETQQKKNRYRNFWKRL
jgi:hypothetical protein